MSPNDPERLLRFGGEAAEHPNEDSGRRLANRHYHAYVECLACHEREARACQTDRCPITTMAPSYAFCPDCLRALKQGLDAA